MEKHKLPDWVCELVHKPLEGHDIAELKAWAGSLPIVRHAAHDHHHNHKCCCCCCCCCCCKKEKGSQKELPTGTFTFIPSIELSVDPYSGPNRLITRVRGSFSWNAPPGTQSVSIQWEQFGPNGNVILPMSPMPGMDALPPSGYQQFDYTGQYGHRIHFQARTDTNVVSDIYWRDGNGGAGWI